MSELNWGVLGVSSHFRKRIALPLQKNRMNKLCAIASRDLQKAEKEARKLGGIRAFGSYDDIINDDEVQAVYIPLPNSLHLEWIEKAAAAGKHVLCEKPLTLNTEDTISAFESAREKGVYLMEAFMFQFHPLWIRVLELIDTGEIGDLRAVHSFFTYSNTKPENIRNKPELGGGAIRDIGCYGIAATNFITDKSPDRVSSLLVKDYGFGTDMLSSFTQDYGTFHSTCTVSTQTFAAQSVEILGTGGSIRIPIPFNIFPDVESVFTIRNSIGEREISTGPADQYDCQFDAFARGVEEKDEEFFARGREFSITNQTIMDGVFRSAEEDRWVELGTEQTPQ